VLAMITSSSTSHQQVQMGEEIDLDFFKAQPIFQQEEDIQLFYGNLAHFQTTSHVHLAVCSANPPANTVLMPGSSNSSSQTPARPSSSLFQQ